MKYWLIIVATFWISNDVAAQCLSGDCVNGRGKFQYPSGAMYQGEFVDGEIHGVGKLTYSDGREYIGEWVNRYQEGKGKMTLPDGRVFKGYWKRGEFYGEDLSGEPIAINEDEVELQEPEVQTGCIVGNCENGTGTMLFADGSKYEGVFANSKINGYGTYYYANNSKYTGEWKNGYYHGEGTKYNNPKDVRVGLWQNGEYLGTKEDQSKKGCISGNCENGEGSFVYADGSKYIGDFVAGAAAGQGICYYSTGNKYTGGWKANTFHGSGTMYFANGQVTAGTWDNGNFLGAAPPSESELAALAAENAKIIFDPTMTVYAVIVGVAKYNHMPVLNYTDDDAYRMFAHLMSPQGGALGKEQITILIDEDATKKKILQTMQQTFAKADSNDMVLLYFSGHGLKGAFLPFDFDGFNNKLFHEEVKTVFNASNAKFKICIADACHSGSLDGFAARGGTTTASTVIANYYKAFEEVGSGTALLLSSKAEETSLESSGLRQGIFSHFLMRGLEGEADIDNNAIVTIQELHNYIYVNVRAYTGNWQTPVLEGNFDSRMPISVIRK